MKNRSSWLKVMDWAHQHGSPKVSEISSVYNVSKDDWVKAREETLEYFPSRIITEIDNHFGLTRE